ncbi:hypothetical protein ACQPX6_25120 [Actinomycetospora sp. CA-101289]|uniref:hypothetical protein n=1 Tax=Actinomycetospora sp. CA-101289 TaxID=3239893 RepID=UPI003D972031
MTGTEPGKGVTVELLALRADASVWQGASEELGERRAAVESTAIDPATFSMWAVDAGLDRVYEEVRVQVAHVLGQGAGAFRSIGGSLDAAADTYGREDARGAGRYRSVRRGGG